MGSFFKKWGLKAPRATIAQGNNPKIFIITKKSHNVVMKIKNTHPIERFLIKVQFLQFKMSFCCNFRVV